MMHDYDRLASLFTQDGTVRLPHAYAGAVGREDMRAGGEQLQALLDYMVQTTHPGTIQLAGDTATGRAYIQELARTRDGRQGLNFAIYHDRYQRTSDGWRFTERVYEIRYLDDTPLAGSALTWGSPSRSGRPDRALSRLTVRFRRSAAGREEAPWKTLAGKTTNR